MDNTDSDSIMNAANSDMENAAGTDNKTATPSANPQGEKEENRELTVEDGLAILRKTMPITEHKKSFRPFIISTILMLIILVVISILMINFMNDTKRQNQSQDQSQNSSSQSQNSSQSGNNNSRTCEEIGISDYEDNGIPGSPYTITISSDCKLSAKEVSYCTAGDCQGPSTLTKQSKLDSDVYDLAQKIYNSDSFKKGLSTSGSRIVADWASAMFNIAQGDDVMSRKSDSESSWDISSAEYDINEDGILTHYEFGYSWLENLASSR